MRRSIQLALLSIFLSSACLNAQNVTATFQGRCLSEDGNAVQDARVGLKNQNTGLTRFTVSSSNGSFQFPLVPPGKYQLTGSKQDFSDVAVDGLDAAINQIVNYDLIFKLASTSESVQVVGQTPLVDSTSSSLGAVIPSERIQSIPVESREFFYLGLLTPGTLPSRRFAGYDQLPEVGVGSQSINDNNVSIDGGSVNDPGGGYQVSLATPLDSLEEFQFLSNRYSAEFGGGSGGSVNVISRSGTNQFHGDGFVFFRDDAFDSKDHFATNEEKTPLNRQQFGFTAGGPIKRDRIHFFTAFDGLRSDQTLIVDTGRTIPGDGPLPYRKQQDGFVTKLDVQAGASHHITGKYAYGYFHDKNFASSPSIAESGRLHSRVAENLIGLADVWLLNGQATGEIRFHYFRLAIDLDSNSTATEEFRPSSTSGSALYVPQHRIEQRFQWNGNVSYFLVKGKSSHSLKSGVDIQALPIDQHFSIFERGAFSFDTDEAFDPNDSSTFPSLSIQGDRVITRKTSWILGLYVNDDWTISEKLTLNLGLRYDLETKGLNEDVNNPVPFIANSGLDTNNLGPRIGFSYSIRKNTVLRGGYGRYYTRVYNLVNAPRINIPLVFTENPDYHGFSNPNAQSSDSEILVSATDPNIQIPFNDQVSFGTDHELSETLAVSMDYVHTRGTDEILQIEGNPADATTGQRLYPAYGSIPVSTSAGQSHCDALQVFLRKRTGNRSSYAIGYQFSRTRNNHDFYDDLVPSLAELAREDGPSLNDERHRFTGNAVFELPADFTLSGTLTWSSAQPFCISESASETGHCTPDIRPPGVPRNAGRGDAFFRTDLRLSKTFALKSSRVEAIAEFYNLFNTKNIDPDSISGVIGSAQFGEGGSTANPLYIPRQIQFGARITF